MPKKHQIDPPARDWRDKAQCRDASPHLYDLAHVPMSAPVGERDREAEALCDGCPVKRDCAADAYAHEDFAVVRGGVWLRHPQTRDLLQAATTRRNRR